jgi:hypothetical protein
VPADTTLLAVMRLVTRINAVFNMGPLSALEYTHVLVTSALESTHAQCRYLVIISRYMRRFVDHSTLNQWFENLASHDRRDVIADMPAALILATPRSQVPN